MDTQKRGKQWWKTRTKLEKVLIITSIIFLILLAILLIAVIVLSYITNKNSDICLTPGCIHAASDTLNNIDLTINPCDDFYEFACGNFIKNTIIPENENFVSSIEIAEDQLMKELKLLLNQPSKNDEIRPFRLIKDFYKSCMDVDKINERGLEPMKRIISYLLGWPVLNDGEWNSSNWNLVEFTRRALSHGLTTNHLFTLTTTEAKSLNKIILNLDQSDFEKLDDETKRNININYINFKKELAMAFGANESLASLKMEDAVFFEISLENIAVKGTERHKENATIHHITVKELKNQYKFFDWDEFFKVSLPNDIVIEGDEIINIAAPEYFSELEKLLNSTPKQTVVNFIMSKIVESSLFLLPDDLIKSDYEKFRELKEKPRNELCLHMSFLLEPAMSSLFVRNNFEIEFQDEAANLFENIRQEYIKHFENVNWIDFENYARDRLNTLTADIGYKKEHFDDEKLNNFYKDLEIYRNLFFESAMNILKFKQKLSYSSLSKPLNDSEWSKLKPALSYAIYNVEENSIEFPAGIILTQYASIDNPKYMIYGRFGHIVGHEIAHSVAHRDDAEDKILTIEDSTYDTEYYNKMQCIKESYEEFKDPYTNQYLNGTMTLVENTADILGIKLSYLAYIRFINENKRDQRLPGINFTNNQMFWISVAQSYCKVMTTEFAEKIFDYSIHAPEKFRVIGPLVNIKEFAEDFHCPVGSFMNPKKKCDL